MHTTELYKKFSLSLPNNLTSLTVALSGGVDSVVLLNLAKCFQKLNPAIKLNAIHIDHGLSVNAKQWREFCTQLCHTLEINFNAISVDVIKTSRQSLEAIAREQRYSALFNNTTKESIILLGQHQDDQVETFFLQLKRGAGLSGLSAMKSVTKQQGFTLIRPLLSCTRAQIEEFAKTFNIDHIFDESNLDTCFDRNFLRAEVLPVLGARFKGFNACVSRSIDIIAQQNLLIEEISQQDFAQVSHEQCVSVDKLKLLSTVRQCNVIRFWLSLNECLMPSKAILNQILEQAINAREDAKIKIALKLNLGEIAYLRRYRGHLYLVIDSNTPDNLMNIKKDTVELSDGRKLAFLPATSLGIRSASAHEVVSIRFSCPSIKFKPNGKPGNNTVKHWLKDAKVPSWQRDQVPLVFYNEKLVQVVGYFIADGFISESNLCWQFI